MREQQQHRTGTSRSHTPNTVLEPLAQRVCALIPSPHSRMFTSVSVGSILRSYLFTSTTTVRIGVHSAPKYGTETIRYVTLLFRYWCGAASLRYRNHAEITVVVCEQKPYPVFAPAQKLSGTAWTSPNTPSALRLAALQFANIKTANDMSFQVLQFTHPFRKSFSSSSINVPFHNFLTKCNNVVNSHSSPLLWRGGCSGNDHSPGGNKTLGDSQLKRKEFFIHWVKGLYGPLTGDEGIKLWVMYRWKPKRYCGWIRV